MANLIEPSSFDLIVLGTGLPQCIIAAAAASSGHSVLHLDTCDFYGSHWASLPLQDFSDWCHSAGQLPFPSSSQVPAPLSYPRTDDGVLRDAVHHGSASTASGESVETMRDSAMEGDVQNAEDNMQDGTEGEDVEAEDAAMKVLGERVQYAAENSTLELEDNGVQMQDAQKVALKDNSSSLAMEEMGLEPVMVEPGNSMYRNFHFMWSSVQSLGLSRGYCIDLAGPKLAFCGGPLVDLLLRSGASNYLDFKTLEGSFMWSTEGLASVPSSRADVFKDRTLGNAEKRHLMRFFKLVVEHASSNSDTSQISTEEMESPFVEFLQARQVPSSVQAYKSK